MKEIVIISGKGGTGKTSITASFAAIARNKVALADCDVDAADLHIILDPSIKYRAQFKSGHKALINQDKCIQCNDCKHYCRYDAVTKQSSDTDKTRYTIDPIACEGCGVCVHVCPVQAIDFKEEVCGEWYISDTRFGPMVHARLGIAAENSGRLVTLVRKEANRVALESNLDYVLIDGSPGIGCPVIASLTAANTALIVTEPTVSGNHDLRRIADLTKKLGIKTFVCINKWDINPSLGKEIIKFAEQNNLHFAGTIRYDKNITNAQRNKMSIIEYTDTGASEDIVKIWNSITSGIKNDT
jgi:MinD superfamily P-loop ATPase